jgi:hypothetical protein
MNNRGNISAKLWLVQNFSEVKEADKLVGEIFSGTAGYHFNKMLEEAGLSVGDIFYCVNSDTQATLDLITLYRPPIILLCGPQTTKEFVPDVAARKKPFEVSLDKQAGSLLQSSKISFPHYCIPIWPVEKIYLDWSYRDVYINLDLGHAHDELKYFTRNGSLQGLSSYNFCVEPSFAELKDYFFDKLFKSKTLCAGDIETIGHQIRKKSLKKLNRPKLFGHPGMPYVMGLANSPTEAVSFSFWDYKIEELVLLWRWLDALLSSVSLIGQNFLNFDLIWLEALGFTLNKEKIQDTYIRQHILWPELQRSLQFMVKQYTRIPYYKDEGKHWSPKQKKTYMKYNALDCVATYQVYLKQEEEFQERPHLK